MFCRFFGTIFLSSSDYKVLSSAAHFHSTLQKKKKGIFLRPEYYPISHSKLPKSTVLTFLLGFWLSGIIWKQKGKSKTNCGAVIIVPYSIIIIHFYNESHMCPPMSVRLHYSLLHKYMVRIIWDDMGSIWPINICFLSFNAIF